MRLIPQERICFVLLYISIYFVKRILGLYLPYLNILQLI